MSKFEKKLNMQNLQNEEVVGKSKEHLQAQAEIFSGFAGFDSEYVRKASEDQAKLLKYSSELAKIKDLNNLPSDLPPELIGLVKKYKKFYIRFLRQNKTPEEIAFIEENIKLYNDKFGPLIKEFKDKKLKDKISLDDFKQVPEYIGVGANGVVFRLKIGEKNYAAKFFYNITQENIEVKWLYRAKGVPHANQIVSYSFEDSVIISELLPGITAPNLTIEEKPKYFDKQLFQLIDTVVELYLKGLIIDNPPDNILYDEKYGFSILDFAINEDLRDEYRKELWQNIGSLERMINAIKFKNINDKYSTINQFSTILKEKYPDIFIKLQKQK